MKLCEMIKVMKHFDNGGEVEINSRNGNYWTKITSPSWDWVYHEYRIKPEKQKVTIEKWLCRSNFGSFVILECSNINMVEGFAKVKLLETYEVEL